MIQARDLSAPVLLSLLLLQVSLTPEARAASPPQARSYEMEIDIVPGEGRMNGSATIVFDRPAAPGEPLVFFLHGELRVDSVEGPAGPVRWAQEPALFRKDYSMVATRVTLDPGREGPLERITVRYGGHFNPSKARSPSDYMRIDATGAYLRSYGYSLWFPVFVEPPADPPVVSFPAVRIRTPADLIPVFVGERVAEDIVGSHRVSTWRARDVPLQTAQLTARPFARHEAGGFFVYSGREAADIRAAQEIGQLAGDLVKDFRGRYLPGVSAGQFHIAELPRYGDISSGNMVGMSEETWREFGRTDWAARTLAHEIVHPFVQIPTPPGSPLRALVLEGFPSYFHLPVLAGLRGEALYDDTMDRVQDSYLKKRASGVDRRGRPLPPEKPILEIGEDEIGAYKDVFVLADRALLFLDHLRRSMQPEGFRAFARNLFSMETLTKEILYEVIEDHLPGGERTARIWLETTEYPAELRRPSSGQ